MITQKRPRQLSCIKVLVLVVLVFVLASLFFPRYSRENGRKNTCINYVREIANAIQMYRQDHQGHYPDYPWTNAVTPYISDTRHLLCPSDASNASIQVVSYGYNGNLLLLNNKGVAESQVINPAAVGLICDCSPSRPIGDDSYIPGGGLNLDSTNGAVPSARHSKGIVTGFCDGHVQYIHTDYVPNDLNNPVTKAFYECLTLGTVDNPGGGLPSSSFFKLTHHNTYARLTSGGEYCTRPLIAAMTEVWNAEVGDSSLTPYYHPSDFQGQYSHDTSFRKGTDYLWGTVEGAAGTAIAHDCVVVIAAKNTLLANNAVGGLDLPAAPTPANGWHLCTPACIRQWFTEQGGAARGRWQAYTLSAACATRKTFARYFTEPGKRTMVVANDHEMVNSVAGNPHGIGYCSSAFLDLDRVQVLGLLDTAGKQYFFPNRDGKYNTALPVCYDMHSNYGFVINVDWPRELQRTLRVQAAGEGARILREIGGDSGNGSLLNYGPCFACNYW